MDSLCAGVLRAQATRVVAGLRPAQGARQPAGRRRTTSTTS